MNNKIYVAEASERPLIVKDNGIYRKDPAEKEMLRILKHTNTVARKQEFGPNYKKKLNTTNKSIGKIKMAF